MHWSPEKKDTDVNCPVDLQHDRPLDDRILVKEKETVLRLRMAQPALLVKYVEISDDSARVLPQDCVKEVDLAEGTVEALERVFPGSRYSLWDGAQRVWIRVEKSTEGLLKDGVFLKVIRDRSSTGERQDVVSIFFFASAGEVCIQGVVF